MSEHRCSNCDGLRHFDIKHVCKPVGEKRIRKIVREEIRSALNLIP